MTTHAPDPALGFTSDRDLQARIRRGARRRASIPAVALPPGPCVVLDQMNDVAGWKAYQVDVPAGGTVKVRLRGPHEAWFRVRATNRWGRLEEGMLQNIIPTGNPEASYKNPRSETMRVYFVVDTTEISSFGEAYRLEVRKE